ncbi:MAG: RdgB/HAM1 family non-canonical purine NTP pyrophosphatase [Pseudomonadota bacterium]|nr:RdgB/HAM1 family non-canonical purine NTP pyrophosphatase [Pseudomonadota bacterium]
MPSQRAIVLASGNRGKLSEFQGRLAPLGWTLVPQSDFDIPPAEETGETFVENAILKARHAARLSGLPALADDSGLEVPALGGAPGIHSARYAGASADDQANIARLLDALADKPDQDLSARFYCVVVYMRHAADPTPVIGQGSWWGHIRRQPHGSGGFGYDPVFEISGLDKTAAELSREHKNRLSHRAMALTQLLQQLRTHAADHTEH